MIPRVLCTVMAFCVLVAPSLVSAQSRTQPEPHTWRRFFLEAGYSLGGGSVHPGMPAASTPSLLRPSDNPQFDGLPRNDAYMPSGFGACTLDDGAYCVRVNRPGFGFVHGLHLGAGMFITPRWGIAVNARYAWDAGPGGTMRNIVLGARALYRFTKLRETGFQASVFLGGTVGQIQVQPEQSPTPPSDTVERPWVQTGLGGVDAGLKLVYRFVPAFGVFASPRAYVLFPRTSVGFEATIGVDVWFGPTKNAAQKQREEQARAAEARRLQQQANIQNRNVQNPQPEQEPPEENAQASARTEEQKPEGVEGFTQLPDGRWRSDVRIHFELESSRLDDESRARIETIAKEIKNAREVQELQIVGHTDSRGPDWYNDPLSVDRAKAVRTYLVYREGVHAEHVTIEGKGSHEPLVPHAHSDQEFAKNRRVVIYLKLMPK